MPLVYHIVHFGYKSSTTPEQKQQVFDAFLAMKDGCKLDGGKGEKYIQSLSGGSNISPEGQSHGLEHSFVGVFRNIQERDYYLDTDPVHDDFKKFCLQYIEKATVMDFEDGKMA